MYGLQYPTPNLYGIQYPAPNLYGPLQFIIHIHSIHHSTTNGTLNMNLIDLSQDTPDLPNDLYVPDLDSWVWQYFKLSLSQPETAFCCISGCTAKKVNRARGNTTNLIMHLKRRHQKTEPRVQKKTTIRDLLEKSQVEKFSESKKKELDTKLISMFIDNYLSFSTTDSESFIKFISFLSEGKYIPPGRSKLTKMIDEMYEDMVKVLIKDTENQCISVTTDGGLLKNSHSYITVTGHYIVDDFTLRDVILAVETADTSHTGDYIADLLTKLVRRFSSTGQAFSVVTDNGSNFVNGAKTAVVFEESLRCAVHSLQLAVKDASNTDEQFAMIAKKARKIVKRINKSHPLRNQLVKLQEEEIAQKEIFNERSTYVYFLVKDVPTRFNTLCLVFKRLLKLRTIVTKLAEEDGNEELGEVMFDRSDWETMEQYTTVLVAIKDVCDQLETTKSPSLSILVALVFILSNTLVEIYRSLTNETAQRMCKIVLDNVRTRYSNNINKDVIHIALILDPRLKDAKLPYYDYSYAKQRLLEIYNDRSTTRNSLTPSLFSSSPSLEKFPISTHNANKEQPNKYRVILSSLSYNTALQDSQDAEIEHYFKDRGIMIDECPLQWWKNKQSEYPKLSQLARIYLSIPASTASSERSFSVGGLILHQNRRSLSPERVSRLIFMKYNMNLYEKLKSK